MLMHPKPISETSSFASFRVFIRPTLGLRRRTVMQQTPICMQKMPSRPIVGCWSRSVNDLCCTCFAFALAPSQSFNSATTLCFVAYKLGCFVGRQRGLIAEYYIC